MHLKGVNLGGWLLMEGYILHGRNIAEAEFKSQFKKTNGQAELARFEKAFRDTFITEADFKNIAAMGANVVRLPFNHKLVEQKPFVYSKEGTQYLAKALDWAKRHKLKVILDLHAAPGSQNCDWHSDSSGKAFLWEHKSNRERTYKLWQYVADTFKGHPALAGYDVLNEPVLANTPKNIALLSEFYRKTIAHIRQADTKSTIWLEGNTWSQQIDFLADLLDDNIEVSIHTYLPLFYTFNFTPFYRFPGKIEGEQWNDKKMHAYLKPYYDFSRKHNVKIFSGEFGIHWRGGYFGELKWLESILKTFDQYGFDYTYWTYKAVANHKFPDGLYQHIPENKYIGRFGNTIGWETYYKHWGSDKKEIIDFWKTKTFMPNRDIIGTLKKHFKHT